MYNFGGSPIGNSRVKLTNTDDCVKRGYVEENGDPIKVATNQLIKDQVDTFKKTAIVVLHDLELAANFCDQLLLLSEGEILSMGAPKSVLTRRNIQEAFDTNVSIETHPLTGLLTINVID